MTIYGGFSHEKWWLSIAYVSLPEGIGVQNGCTETEE